MYYIFTISLIETINGNFDNLVNLGFAESKKEAKEYIENRIKSLLTKSDTCQVITTEQYIGGTTDQYKWIVENGEYSYIYYLDSYVQKI